MKQNKRRPFTAPRLVTAPQTAHRKDNSAWGKTMEKELAQIEKRQQAKVQSKPDTVTPSLDVNSDSEEDSLPIAQTIQASKEDSDDDNLPIAKTLRGSKHSDALGKIIAKHFGEQGTFTGEVVGVEYDSEDEAQEAPFYVVQYDDGDREDMTEEELSYACELHFQVCLDREDEEQDAQDLGNDSDGPPKVRPTSFHDTYFFFINLLLFIPYVEATSAV
jgi:hypothetical protein